MKRAIGLLVSLALAGLASAQPAPERIISISPSVSDILAGVGAFDRVVAVSRYCKYPPGVEKLPRVGGWMDTNLEQIVVLAPDLIIVTDAQAPLLRSELEALGMRVLVVGSQSLQDIFDAVHAIGEAVGNEAEARELAAEMREELDLIRERVAGRPRPRVLTVVDRLPGALRDIYVATGESYLVSLVRIAGGEPLTPQAPHNYVSLGVDAVVSHDPEVIFDMVQSLQTPTVLGSGPLGEDPDGVWSKLGIRAVRNGRVYPLLDKQLVHPSQFAVRTAWEMARRIHPDAFDNEGRD